MDDYEGPGWDFDIDYLRQPDVDFRCRQCGTDMVDIGRQDGEEWRVDLACPRCDEAIVAPRLEFWNSAPKHVGGDSDFSDIPA